MQTINRSKQIEESVKKVGKEKTAELFGISPESVRRACRRARKSESAEKPVFTPSQEDQFRTLQSRFTPQEIDMIISGSVYKPEHGHSIISFEGEEICIGFITDTHMGAKHFSERYWYSAINECHRQGVKYILHAGDVTEGMSHRPEQIYQLAKLGSTAQIEYARDLIKDIGIPFKFIDGNHDRWSIASAGVYIGVEIARGLDNVEFLGNDYGTVDINGTDWMLQHGNDGGGSYARSYRAQKKVESFKPGYKPNVLLMGHDHKQNYACLRNVHTIQGGALCEQSEFMRSTGKENCDGFHIIKAGIADGEIKWLEPRWYQYY